MYGGVLILLVFFLFVLLTLNEKFCEICVSDTETHLWNKTNFKKILSIYLLEKFNFGQVMFQIKNIISDNLHLLIEVLHDKPEPCVKM